MSTEETITLSIEGPVATLTLRRPNQLNALNQKVLVDLNHHLDVLERSSEVRAVIVRGEGKAFAAGADIKEMGNFDSSQVEKFAVLGQKTFRRLENLHCPTIALVQGHALGGGMELAMACDIRIAATDAKFGQPEVTLGIIPGFGGSQRLSRIIGQGRALAMLLTGKLIDANAALDIGLVTEVVETQELNTIGRSMADKLANLAPRALYFVKRAVYEGGEIPLNQGLVLESAYFGLCFSTADQTEGMLAFIEKRKPNFRGL